LYLNGVYLGSSSPSGMSAATSVNNGSGRNMRINNAGVDKYHTKAENSILRINNKALPSTESLQN